MKKYIFLLLSGMAIHTYAQNSLQGTVTDKATGTALPGVSVVVTDLRQGAVTDTQGRYLLKNMPAGSFLMEVRYLGYRTQTQQVSVQGDAALDFSLDYAVTEVNEVVVTGTTRGAELRRHPVAVATIDNLSLAKVNATNLIDAISKKPGLAQITTGAGISKPVIRGLGYNRIVTLYNGLRQEGQQWGDEHGTEIDEFSVDRVEVLKGPGSLLYGSDALGGVVNFLTSSPLPSGEIRSGALLNYQSNNNLAGASIVHTGNVRSVRWQVRASAKAAGNYRNRYDGRVWNSGFNERDLNGYAGLHKKWGYSHLHFSTFHQNIGLVEGERDGQGQFLKPVRVNDTLAEERPVSSADLKGYGLSVPRQAVDHSRLSNTTSLYFGGSNLVFSLGFQQNNRREYGDPLNAGTPGLFFRLNTWNYDVRLLLPAQRGWRSTLGLNGMQQRNRNKGAEALAPAYGLFDIGGYVITERTFGKLNFSGGLRYDHRRVKADALYIDAGGALTEIPGEEVKFAGFGASYAGTSGSIGAAYIFNDRFSVKLNLARGFRSPNIAETGSNGRHEGTFRYEIGDSRLKPENSLQTDLGLFFNSDHVTAEISLFYNAIDRFIFAEKLHGITGGDSIVDPTDPAPAFRFVQGNAYLAGGEISFDLHPHPLDWLHFENSFSWVKGFQRDQPDSSRYLPFIPAARLRSELRGDFKKIGKRLANAFIYAEASYTFDQNRFYGAFGTETETPGYFQLNAGLGGQVLNAKKRRIFTLYILADNLLDVAYQSHLSRLKYAPPNMANGRTGVFNMGRNLSIKMLVPLAGD